MSRRHTGRVTVVDVTLPHEGRDGKVLAKLSARSGVHVVMCTGCSAREVAAIAHMDDHEQREAQARVRSRRLRRYASMFVA
eukprot:6184549-Pleurochrysis_carterae.AAC.3